MRSKRLRKIIWTLLTVALLGGGAYLVFDALSRDPLVSGREALEDGDFRTAVVMLERAIQRGRGSPEVYADLAHAYQVLKRHPKAVRALAEATALRPHDHDLMRRYGEALILAGDQEDPPVLAAETFARDYVLGPEGERLAHGYYILGRALQARYGLSMDALEEEIRREHDGPHVWQILGAIRFALRAEDYFGAARSELIEHLVRRAGFTPTDPVFERVSTLRRLQESALAALRKAETLEQSRGYPAFARATFLLELGQRDEVIRLCRKSFAADNRDVAEVVRVRTQRLLATALAEDPDATDAQLREATGLWGAHILGLDTIRGTPRERNLLRFAAQEARGQLFVRLKDPEGLNGVAASLLDRDPDNAVGLFFRGMAAYLRGAYEDAELDLNASLNRRPDYVTYSTLGTILAKRGGGVNTEQALQRIRAAARIDPGAIEPLIAEVRLYLDLPDPNYMDAYERIRQALKSKFHLGQRSREILELRDEIEINLLKRSKDESYDSPAAAEAALALHRGALYPLYYLATHYEQKGNAKLAEKYAEQLYRRARNQMLVSLVYARALLCAGTEVSLQKAELILNQAQDLDRTDGRPISLAVRVARARHQDARAWRLLNRIPQCDPFDVESRLEIAQGCLDSGNPGGARYVVDYLLSILGDPPYALRRLDLELKLEEKKTDAVARSLAVLETRDDVPAGDLDYLHGRLNEVLGRSAHAIACYDRALARSPAKPGPIVVAAARLEITEKDEHAALQRVTAFRAKGGRDAEVNALLGELLMRRWRLDEAMQVFDEMRRINFGDRRGQIGFGLCTLYTGKRLGAGLAALQYALQSITRDPRFLAEGLRVLRAAVFGRLEQRNWSAALTLLTLLEQIDRGTGARARALLAYFNGDHDAARELVERWSAEGRKSPYLRLLRGLLTIEQSRTEGVCEDVSALVADARPGPPWRDYVQQVARELPGFGRLVLATTAHAALLEGDVDTAEKILAAARAIYSTDHRLAHLDAHVAFRRGRANDAIAALRQLEPRGNDVVLRDLAIMCALEGLDDGPLLMQRFVTAHGTAADPLLAWARFEVGGDHYLKILHTLDAAPRWRWTLFDRVVLVGLACLVDGSELALSFVPGDESLSGPYLRRWVLDATTPPRLHRLARLVRAVSIGRVPLFRDAAVTELQKILVDTPDDPLLLGLLAELQLRAHRRDAAAALVARIDDSADRPLALLARGRVEAAAGDTATATATLQELIRLRPLALEARLALGRILLDGGKPAAAADILLQVPDTPEVLHNPRRLLVLGQALEATGDPSGAISAYARALNGAPNNREIAGRLVQQLLASRQYPQAAAILAGHPRLATERPEVRLRLGLALVRLNQHAAARQFLIGFPYSAQAAAALGRIALANRNKEEAIRQLRCAYHLDSVGHKGALLEVAEIQMSEYDFRAALKTVNLLLVQDPTNHAARVMQAQCMEHVFKPKQALFGWVQAWLVNRSDPRPLLKAAILLRKESETELAKVLIEQVLARLDKLDEELREELDRECYYLGMNAPARR